jgi:hypothetical protein
MKRVDELCRFAFLTSDRTFSNNFIGEYSSINGHPAQKDSADLRLRLLDDIAVLLHMRPMIDAGVIEIAESGKHFCPNCLKNFGIKGNPDSQISKLTSGVASDLLRSCDVTLARTDECDVFQVTVNSRHILDHDIVFDISNHELDDLRLSERDLSSAHSGQTVKLPKRAIRKIGIHLAQAESVVHDVVHQISSAHILKSGIVTHRPIHCKLAGDMLGADADRHKLNDVILRHMDLVVPFLEELSLQDLALLRASEGDSFVRFRSAMARAVRDIVGRSGRFGPDDAKQMYGDVIEPRLAELRIRTKLKRKQAVMIPASCLISTGIVVTLGIASGVVPLEIIQMVSALGGLGTPAAAIASGIQQAGTTEAIKLDEYYFLLRARARVS